MKAKETKSCKCLDQVQDKLVALSKPYAPSRIVTHLLISLKTGVGRMSPPALHLEKIESKARGRLPVVMCTFCPFCGKKYDA